MMKRKDAAKASTRVRLMVGLAVAASALAGLAAIYAIGGLRANAVIEAECRPAVARAQRLGPLTRGEVAAVAVSPEPRHLPELHFRNAAGDPQTLADWRGRVVLLNLWATWCVPCRKEMPTLDRLKAELGSAAFDVIAVNIDTRDPEKPRAWLAETGMRHLAYYADPTAKVFQDLKLAGRAFGMPTTFIVDRRGCELGSLAGPADWSSEDALTLLKAALAS
jgi:thiol-disulfide isomerase/thioredoxin